MAKRDETSPRVTRKMAARQHREQAQNRRILLGSAVVIAIVLILVFSGLIFERIIIPRQPIIEVKGDTITTREFQTRVRYERNQLVNRYFNTLQTIQLFGNDPQTQSFFLNSLNQIEFQLEPSTLGREVLNVMIEDYLIRREAETLNIIVTDEEVDLALEEFFGYYGGGYQPTSTQVATALPTSTFSPEQLALITLTPTPVITITATPTPPPEPTSTPSAPTPTPYSLEAFQSDYQETLDILQRDIRFSETDLRRLIEAQLYREKLQEALTGDLSNTQEQVWARHILVEDLETAQEALDRLENGEDFGLLAQELSTDQVSAARGGDLNWFSRGDMVAEFEETAFSLAIGQISEPVESQFGYHIIQVLGHEERPLEASDLQQFQTQKFQEWLTQAREEADPDIQIFEYWANRVPTEPSIPPGYTQAFLSQLSGTSQPGVDQTGDGGTSP